MNENRANHNNRADLIEFLSKKSSYAHNPKNIKHIQTHCSDVFLVPPFVYKLKKPVDLGFLNYSTLENRKYYCKKEVELNCRLSSGIYLGVEEISKIKGKYVFGDGEVTIDYAVLMKMLPEELSLQYLLENKEVGKNVLIGIVEKLYNFYIEQKSNREIENYGKCKNIKSQIGKNLTESYGFVGKTISPDAYKTINYFKSLFFKNKSSLFEYRSDKGFIKDCHGDLRLEHIYLQCDLIQIIDCIEFNDKFRYIDVASDIAFLSMDMDFRGFREFSRFLVSEFSKRFEDKSMYEIIDFYKCYRAYVRGKVEGIKAFEPEVPDSLKEQALEKAKEYFKLALRYALFGSRPALLITFGMIGSGKSTLANDLSRELSCEVLSSDILRKEITGTEPTERKYEEYGSGIYAKEITETTYKELAGRGIEIIKTGAPVVLDASFSKRKWRELIRSSASKFDIPVYFIQTLASDSVIRERLLMREREGGSVSDGRLEILGRFASEFEEPGDLGAGSLITVNTTTPEQNQLGNLFEHLVNINLESGYENG